MVLRKHELEAKLSADKQLVKNGVLREDNPLDLSDDFDQLIEACRRADLKRVQELVVSKGVNINAKNKYDYTPLNIASLCGHYDLVQYLLESGALCERDTFEGERCIYNALNDRIRNLLRKYDFSKSTDPLQPWAAHITSLLYRTTPKTHDITIAARESLQLHKFFLAARSPYFRKKLQDAPGSTSWKLPETIPVESFSITMRYLYLDNMPREIVKPWSTCTEEEVLTGVDKISKQLEVTNLWDALLSGDDRRMARQRHQDEVVRAAQQLGTFFRERILGAKMRVDVNRVHDVKWRHDNSIFADCLLRADEPVDSGENGSEPQELSHGIPIGPSVAAQTPDHDSRPKKAVLYPVHKAMLIRSEYFDRMFKSSFLEAQDSEHLHIITIDCEPKVLELILSYCYTEHMDIPLELGLDLLYAADMLFLDKVKTKAAVAISTLGNGNNNVLVDRTHTREGEGEPAEAEAEPINVYDVIHAAWDLKVQRLEEFAAKYLANRLEDYIDEEEFAELIEESAKRLKTREETDTIELLDDIRHYLSERFRLRFEAAGLEKMLEEEEEINRALAETTLNGTGNAYDEPAPVANIAENNPEESGGISPVEETSGVEEIKGVNGAVRTLNGEIVEDEFASDEINYRILLSKIDTLLEKLNLDA
ncbi:BTB/POZ domain-containing protein [Pseudomassariella vexata]|uniref:BTB/POZ domain-containing protein n=1 Tax=Pseudomassariella vexata TaxID=1141098 RepID=A0A1Y2E7W3_9PEZI|nr:BTB/POZ domain-containing protein [Pseudomassariella vexata]ORY67414.1 BTB/POZ domain-containing protein [Pseudomassariella vexata]